MSEQRQQNCNVCEYKELPHPDGSHCYMFQDKPAGRCGQMKPVDTKEDAETKSLIRKTVGAWGIFIK